ncbi:MAG: S8 family peptidase [Dyadobacter sp.]|uniref:S8 family peptidase n=1 Tax=Dyadobacter sp. TaxID=1914288 RepID=UPI001B0A56A2|nr:S8 family peptidase [Dyadobacter sp.]MBO9613070.1 S8 family peptidase [Dyadobacter sp.]
MRSIKFKIVLLLLFSSLATFAQTEEEIREIQKSTNIDTLRKMGEEFKAKYEVERKRLLELAQINGWAVSIDLPNGGKKELIGVTADMKPIYQETFNAGSSKMMGADKLYTGGSLGLNVNGESMTAVVFEQNIRATHEAFENRVLYMDPIATSVSNHTTHVTGTIAASGVFQSGKARGIAPKSNVNVYTTSNIETRQTTLASNGLLVSNHSYGNYGGDYNSARRNQDAIMFNAPYYLSVWSCGNDITLDVNAPEKNGISVASVEQANSYTGPSSVVAMSYPGGTWGTTPGPSDDGRIKPDISAKGVGVFSTMAYLPSSSTPSDNTYHDGDGTSFASPAVVGSILLLQQHFTNINSRFMRGATVKALIANSAKEAGPNPGPDVTFGWGLMDVEKAANTITNNGGKSLISEDKILNGYSYSREIVADGSEPLVATISWTDPPGPVKLNNDTTSVLVNDLDLRLSANSATYFPWKLDWSNGKTSAKANPALQGDNNRDNTEKIEIPNPVAGQVYTLTVNHKGSIGTGQNFSIVITGLKECVASRNIVSPVNSFASVTEQASSVITLANTLDSNAHAIYHAGDEVVMTTGFTATRDSQFRGYVEGCTNDYAARLRPVERAVVTYPMPIGTESTTELPENAVYPNPGTGLFHVKLDGIPSGKVEVVAGDGQAMFNRPFKNQSEMEVDIRNSTPGIYILRVVSDQKVLTKKIVKK